MREFLDELQRRAEANRAREELARPGSTWWQRLMGLFLLATIAWLIYRSMRRLRPNVGWGESGGRTKDVAREAPLPEDAAIPPRRRLRRDPPADTVRRWYSEALDALQQAGVPKQPALTPSEFVPEVIAAFPDIERGFRRLTGLYEDVRYGNRRISGDAVRTVEPEIRAVMARLRRPE